MFRKYDIVESLTDHREDLKYLYNLAVGELAPHILPELYCDSLFSQVGNILHTNCSITTVDTFGRLVREKHKIDCVYCCHEKVKMNSLSDGRVRVGMIRKIQTILPFGTIRNQSI